MLCGGIIAIIIDNNGDLKTSLYKSRFIIISTALGAISYKILDSIFKKVGITQKIYNNQIVEFTEIPERIGFALKYGFENLFNYDVAFMPLSMTILFVVVLVFSLVMLFSSSLNLKAKFFIIFLFCGAVFASQTHIILSKVSLNLPRIDYYGLMFVRILIVAFAFKFCIKLAKIKIFTQNIIFVFSWIILWVCIVQDLYAQRVQKFGFDDELNIMNRLADRIEQNENFSYDKKYCGLMIGEVVSMRPKYYKNGIFPEKYMSNSVALLSQVSSAPWWGPNDALKLFMSKNVFDDCGFFGYYDEVKPKFLSLAKRLHKVGILDTLEPWPHKNSVVIFEDIIVFVASKGNLDEIKKMAKTLDDKDVLQ